MDWSCNYHLPPEECISHKEGPVYIEGPTEQSLKRVLEDITMQGTSLRVQRHCFLPSEAANGVLLTAVNMARFGRGLDSGLNVIEHKSQSIEYKTLGNRICPSIKKIVNRTFNKI